MHNRPAPPVPWTRHDRPTPRRSFQPHPRLAARGGSAGRAPAGVCAAPYWARPPPAAADYTPRRPASPSGGWQHAIYTHACAPGTHAWTLGPLSEALDPDWRRGRACPAAPPPAAPPPRHAPFRVCLIRPSPPTVRPAQRAPPSPPTLPASLPAFSAPVPRPPSRVRAPRRTALPFPTRPTSRIFKPGPSLPPPQWPQSLSCKSLPSSTDSDLPPPSGRRAGGWGGGGGAHLTPTLMCCPQPPTPSLARRATQPSVRRRPTLHVIG